MEVLIGLIGLVVGLGLLILFVWGQSGGVVQQQASLVQANTPIIQKLAKQSGLSDPEVHVGWPIAPGEPPREGLALDRTNGRLALAVADGGMWNLFEVEPSTVMAVELLIDGETVSRVSRSQQLGGALVGGLLAGEAGAIIGGLSSGQRSLSTVTRVSLQFIMDTAEVPSIEFCFWDKRSSNGWANLGPEEVRQITGAAKRWTALLEEYMAQNATPAADEELGSVAVAAVAGQESCPKCDEHISEDSRFCPKCGSTLDREDGMNPV